MFYSGGGAKVKTRVCDKVNGLTQPTTPVSDERRWFIVCLLCLGVIIAYVDRSNFSVALAAKEFKTFFHLSDAERGTLNSVFFWSYALLQIPAGFLVDRYGVKYPYGLAFLFWSLVSAATAAASSVTHLMSLRLLLGVGEALAIPAGQRWIRFNVGERQRGLALGIYMSGTKYGTAVGAPVAAWLVARYGWREMFVILGIGSLLWLIPWFTLVRNDDRQLEGVSRKKEAKAEMPFARVLASPLMWGVLIGTFAYNYFTYFCMTWLPAYFVEQRNLSMTAMGTVTGFSFFGMATVAILGGLAADRLIIHGWDAVKVRKGFTIAGLLIASTEVFGALSNSTQVAVAFSIVSLSGLGLATANYWALTQSLVPGAAIGRIVGVQNFAANLSGIVAPLVTGWLKAKTNSFEAPMVAILVLLVIGTAAYIFLVDARYGPKAG